MAWALINCNNIDIVVTRMGSDKTIRCGNSYGYGQFFLTYAELLDRFSVAYNPFL